MEFDWSRSPSEWGSSLTPREIEESFEDPFAVRLLPDSSRFSVQSRYVNMGMTAGGTGVISVYRTNGKLFRIIHARAFSTEEQIFYQRRLNQSLNQ
ncbi:MAG: hypothetical protein HC814_08225 [Rhodobacteraceae bacterium]|nr:hypothetical protein [Paracoccaceae bacterium]